MSDSVANDKNHEQYLEQIEIAVAETTKELMSKHNGDLRAMAKVCAEKQVEINRLKEYYTDDKKTIRNLRVKLKEATEEIDLYKEELDVAHHEYEKIKEEKYSLYLKWSEQKEEIAELKKEIEQWKYWASEVIHWSHSASKDNLQAKNLITSTDQPTIGYVRDFGKEIKELKKEIELQKDYIGAIPDNVEEYKDELHAVMGENRMLKEEIEFLKNQLDVGGFMNFSKYKD